MAHVLQRTISTTQDYIDKVVRHILLKNDTVTFKAKGVVIYNCALDTI